MTVSHLKSFLVSPWTILGSIVVGVLSGVYAPEFSLNFESLGSIYISLLKVVVLPFLLATILVGIIGLLQKNTLKTVTEKQNQKLLKILKFKKEIMKASNFFQKTDTIIVTIVCLV